MCQEPAPAAFIHNFHGDTGVELQFFLQLLSGSTEERPFLNHSHAAFFCDALTVIGIEMEFRIVVSGLFYIVIGVLDRLSRHGCKLRHRPDGFAKQNGRGAERADTLTL